MSEIVEQIMVFAPSANLIKEVKNVSRNFKPIAWRCLRRLNPQLATFYRNFSFVLVNRR